MEKLAIPPGRQRTSVKRLVIAIRLSEQTALHSHLTKLANYAKQVIG
jgi:hypothetical protein